MACLLAVCLLIIEITLHEPGKSAPRAVPIPRAYVGQTIGCGGGTKPYIPPASFFGVKGQCRSITASRYDYESNLVCGHQAVADSDYLFTPGIQTYFRLGGPSWWHAWHHIGSVLIDGSGTVSEWETPNHGCVAFAHLDGNHMKVKITVRVGPIMLPSLTQRPVIRGRPLDGDEMTALAVGTSLAGAIALPALGSGYPPSTQPGLTRWPDWAIYGNGVSGPWNAHLCVIYDAVAAEFFYKAAHHLYQKPVPPFRIKVYESYRVSHHLSQIAAYQNHKLTWPASVWRHHQWLGGIKARGHTYQPKLGVPYTIYPFAHGHMTCWPKRHRCAVHR